MQHIFATWTVVLSLVLEIGAWPVFGLALLLAPILSSELLPVPCPRQWIAFDPGRPGTSVPLRSPRIGLALVVALPLLASWSAPDHLFQSSRLRLGCPSSRASCLAPVLAPVAAYLVVANMFIYLNLRYEAGSRR